MLDEMDNTAQSPSAATPAKEQYCALLEVSEAIAAHRDLASLFQDLAQRLHRVVIFDFLALILYEPARDIMRLHILESSIPPHAEVGMETPLGGTPAGLRRRDPATTRRPQHRRGEPLPGDRASDA